MSEHGDGDGDEQQTLGELRYRGRSLRLWVLAAATAALAVSGAFGGLKKAEAEVPTVGPGQQVEGGRFTVTVDRVTAVKGLEPSYEPKNKDGALLGVVATVTLTDSKGVRIDSDAVTVPGLEKAGVASMREDNTSLPVLQPGVPEQVVFLFDLPKASDVPERATVEIARQRHEEADVLSGKENWFPDGVAGRVDVPVKDNVK